MMPLKYRLRFACEEMHRIIVRLDGRQRVLPHFILIGAQKCGTTSLYQYLVEHPNIHPAFIKEVHYFDLNYHRGEGWYRANFPLEESLACHPHGERQLTGEASPYYMIHPAVPERVAQTCPEAKLIVLLRDPVKRAYSHYQHEVRMGFENLSFIEALKMEEERTFGEEERIYKDTRYRSDRHWHYTYLQRGLYARQLRRWFTCFPRQQILILKSENLLRQPEVALAKVAKFLDLPVWKPKISTRHNVGSYNDMGSAAKEFLREYYRGPNRELVDLLGEEFTWE